MCAETNWGCGKSSKIYQLFRVSLLIAQNYILGDPRMCGKDNQEGHAAPSDRAKLEGERPYQVAARGDRVQRSQ